MKYPACQRIVCKVLFVIAMRQYPEIVVRRDKDALRCPEMGQLFQIVAICIENLDPVVLPMAYIHQTFRIDLNGVWKVELAGAVPFFPQSSKYLPSFANLITRELPKPSSEGCIERRPASSSRGKSLSNEQSTVAEGRGAALPALHPAFLGGALSARNH